MSRFQFREAVVIKAKVLSSGRTVDELITLRRWLGCAAGVLGSIIIYLVFLATYEVRGSGVVKSYTEGALNGAYKVVRVSVDAPNLEMRLSPWSFKLPWNDVGADLHVEFSGPRCGRFSATAVGSGSIFNIKKFEFEAPKGCQFGFNNSEFNFTFDQLVLSTW